VYFNVLNQNEMKSNELRIGNYIHFDNFLGMKYDYQVTPRFFRHLALDSPDSLEIEINGFHQPIPLTEEWLLKFGFTVDQQLNGSGAIINGFKIWKGDSWECWNYSTNKEWIDDNEIYVDLFFVHQLQNLYFALTGKELTLKPE
jgi:hypothetical protein